MVDTGDLKSPDLNSRAGSSPALGTNIKTIRMMRMVFIIPSTIKKAASPVFLTTDIIHSIKEIEHNPLSRSGGAS
ncbi:MAG: hypothetical protein UY00_C0055G0004 [Candidatus Wolfebacteria bacterium GW2011_GWA1_47_6]|nr:MAG: hypothetical protein UY00_C0055G0004 [Candidatus Wolfebacteria bacterium GW2011_GWA1_47_6]